MTRSVARAAAVALLAVMAPGGFGPAPAHAAECAQAGQVSGDTAWPRQMLAMDAIGRFSRGGGVEVAVLSTGVQASNPQLDGRVFSGVDAVAQRGTANTDCTGTGTQVAGVIAAEPADGSPVVGLAYRATVLPIRVVPDNSSAQAAATPGSIGRGIELALQNGAQVIVVACAVYQDGQRMRSAVASAIAQDVPVIAAVGDLGSAEDKNPTPYPAAYDGVIGVGAIDRSGQIYTKSQHGDYVDLVAPGVAVPTLQGGGAAEADGTALAAGYVGAAAALIRNRSGKMPVADLTRLLTASASPAVAGDAFGAGVVNPYAAITGQISTKRERALPAMSAPAAERTGAEQRRRVAAYTGAIIAAVAVVAVLMVTAAIRRSRRQHWRPATAPPLPEYDEPVEPGPPVMLLEQPGPN
ncbi:hypothetical protein GCM10010168_69960 [Actinoplanes ianthinogenes]|uniref:Peptidase S8/S53 domain-containing protein n=2 Tax=Actinoplanes ianthinogenes TaxID=122358 RepID=A0ABM7M0R6_9ACTN|nr:S8 family serine peptidase [Actinoplanes ianthinogenes]BCJ45195.1 hypothetical protein Aiant_58520 [Actinoplanes ianthinogenes]GGR41203.1 hypothetical protein GCM10010168_69960 [Actinoplanes ianthinogenes]